MKAKQRTSTVTEISTARTTQKRAFASREPLKPQVQSKLVCLVALAEKLCVDTGKVSLCRYRNVSALTDVILESSSPAQLTIILRALELSDRAHDPNAYLSFLARPDLNLPAFFDSIGAFAPKRQVDFHEIPLETRDIRDQFVWLIRDVKRYGAVSITKLAYDLLRHSSGRFQVSSREALFEAYLAAAYLTGGFDGDAYANYFPEISDLLKHRVLKEVPNLVVREDLGLAVSNVDDCVNMGNISRYVRRTYLLPYSHSFSSGAAKGFVVTDDEYFVAQESMGFCQGYQLFIRGNLLGANDGTFSFVLNHELQHLFDNLIGLGVESTEDQSEYRATLSEFAFHDPELAPYALCGMKKDLLGKYNSKPHETARRKILREFTAYLHAKSSLWKPHQVELLPALAKVQLNKSYLEMIGVTYDDILEPFEKLKQDKACSS